MKVPATGRSEWMSRRIRWARYGYLALMVLFVAGVLLQVYVAGMAVFVDPSNWALHVGVVHLLEPLLVLLLLLGLLGDLPRRLQAAPVGLFLLVSVQYATANLPPSMVSAVHPVNALVIFSVAALAARRAWSVVSEPTASPSG